MSSDHLALWRSVQETPLSRTKAFQRRGGFKGTAIDPMYMIERATEMFGPLGIGWGFEVVSEDWREGAPAGDGHEIVHVIRLHLWYLWEGGRGELYSYGQTTFVSAGRHGLSTDEEAPKKSLTDAISKALSWLGFAADVHTGKYDDNKYVAEMQRRERNGNGSGTDTKQAHNRTKQAPESRGAPDQGDTSTPTPKRDYKAEIERYYVNVVAPLLQQLHPRSEKHRAELWKAAYLPALWEVGAKTASEITTDVDYECVKKKLHALVVDLQEKLQAKPDAATLEFYQRIDAALAQSSAPEDVTDSEYRALLQKHYAVESRKDVAPEHREQCVYRVERMVAGLNNQHESEQQAQEAGL